MNKIKLPNYSKSRPNNPGVIRVSPGIYDQLNELSKMTRWPIKFLADKLLTESLKRVELVECKLYNMEMEEDEDE